MASFPIAGVFGYYTYKKLTYPAIFCGSIARPDAELGWTLIPNAEGCYAQRDTGTPKTFAFHSQIFTDESGFRSPVIGGATSKDGIFAIGDSWTFGYGVNYENSYPGQLAARTVLPVTTIASPAYGAAQAIALAERWIEKLSPKALVYLDLGLWERSACRGDNKPKLILKPCYWQEPILGDTVRVAPPAGFVEKMWRWGIIPGGALGVGEDGWDYFLLSRPILRGLGYFVRFGLANGMGHDFRAVGVDRGAIKQGVVSDLLHAKTRANAALVFLDPEDSYTAFHSVLKEAGVVFVGKADWQKNVLTPAENLSPANRHVPQDGHFGPGMNSLIADYVARLLQNIE